MTDYAIGDIQGCYERLQDVLAKVDFSPSRDRLWVAGDLINRGPASLKTLRYIESLGDAAVVVLGNHDLHLLAVALGGHKPKKKDTLHDILEAPDCPRLLDWLRHQRLCVFDDRRQLLMAHAGVPHVWTIDEAMACAAEVEAVLRDDDRAAGYFQAMYGNRPERWDAALAGMDRWRIITNYFTRMRFIAEDGTLELATKEPPDNAPAGFAPWFEFARPDEARIVFGHWAALEGRTGKDRFVGLDTGCVWGGALTLMNLDTNEKIHTVTAPEAHSARPLLRWALAAGALIALLAVMAGAFGAHGLRHSVSERGLEVFQTAVLYQMVHALALVMTSALPALGVSRRLAAVACGFWLTGVLLFSGSLYGLVLSGPHWLGPVTPLGGICFMVGWGVLIAAALKRQER